MSTEGATTTPSPETVSPQPAAVQPPASGGAASALGWIGVVLAAAALGSGVLLWQKVGGMQEQLARQSADASNQAAEARTLAREAQDLVRDAAGRLAVVEARVQDVTLQRSQLEELLQSLSRSRDETLLVDLESALRMALQQAELSGSLEPLVAALKSAAQRIERTAQPRLAPVQRAMEQDLERLARASVTDTAGLLGRLDDLVRMVDDMPLLNSVAHMRTGAYAGMSQGVPLPPQPDAALTMAEWAWWQQWAERIWQASLQEVRDLVRIRRIDQPDAILLAPEQSFFLRENLKLKLLNARLGLLARQYDAARADLGNASTALAKYFDGQSRRTQSAQMLLQQIQTHLRQTEQPSINETLSALATAATSR